MRKPPYELLPPGRIVVYAVANGDTYAERLRAALERDDWSQGRLVRELSRATGNAIESERSAIRGYLKGSTPRPERAALIAELTGVPELAEMTRKSASDRLEARLEELEANDAEILENQKVATAEILEELRAIRGLLGGAGGNARRSFR